MLIWSALRLVSSFSALSLFIIHAMRALILEDTSATGQNIHTRTDRIQQEGVGMRLRGWKGSSGSAKLQIPNSQGPEKRQWEGSNVKGVADRLARRRPMLIERKHTPPPPPPPPPP